MVTKMSNDNGRPRAAASIYKNGRLKTRKEMDSERPKKTVKRYSAWGHDGSFRFKFHRDLYILFKKTGTYIKKVRKKLKKFLTN